MCAPLTRATLTSMIEETGAVFALHEFMLPAGTDLPSADAALALAGDAEGGRVPLLSAIDDPRRVAWVRACRSRADANASRSVGDVAGPVAAGPALLFAQRLALGTPDAASYFRLAVAPAGRNTRDGPLRAPETSGERDRGAPDRTTGLLWIGTPLDSPHGLLVLVGLADPGAFAADRSTSWPLPLSTDLGVRIYASRLVC